MRRLNEIAGDVRTLLTSAFPSIRYAPSGMTKEQIQQEIRAISGSALPGAVICMEDTQYTDENTVREILLSLYAIDVFSADSDSRALSVWNLFETLQTIFPMSGRTVNGVFYVPESMTPAGGKENPGCGQLIFRIRAKQ